MSDILEYAAVKQAMPAGLQATAPGPATDPTAPNPALPVGTFWDELSAQKDRSETLRAENVDRYQIALDDSQYEILNQAIAESAMPEEEAYNWATALRYSQYFGTPLAETYGNLENLNEYWLGPIKGAPKSNFIAVTDSFIIGKNTVELAGLGGQLNIAENTGSTEDIKALRGMIDKLNADNAALMDHQARPWTLEALKYGAQSAPFTGMVIGAGLLGSVFSPVAGTGTAFAESMRQQQGLEYLRLRDAGVDQGYANWISKVSGGLQAAVEVALGNVAGNLTKATGANTITSNVLKRMSSKGAFGRIGKILMNYGSEAVEEGSEEAIQELIGSGATAIAAELQGAGVDAPTAEEAARSAMESFKGGFMGSLVLGLSSTAITAKAEFKDANILKTQASTIASREVFIKETAGNKVFEGMTDADRAETQTTLWEAASARREDAITARAAETAGSVDIGNGAEDVLDEEAAPSSRGAVQRTSEGRLHIQEGSEVIQNDDGSTTRILKAGNPNEETSHNRYGYIKFKEYDDRVVIDEFKMAAGRNDIRREFFDAFSEQVAGKDIEWDPSIPAARKFKESIVSENPVGPDAGLQFYAKDTDPGNIRGRVKLDKQIAQYLPKLDVNERAAAVTLLEARAAVRGIDLDTYIGQTFHGDIFAPAGSVIPDAAQAAGVEPGKIKGGVSFDASPLTGDVKALIYVTEKSDFSTYVHEVGHVFRRDMDGPLLVEAERAFGVTDGKWTRDSEERFAVGFEEYLREGKAPSEGLAEMFKKMAEFLHRIYNALANRVEVSPDIRRVYDQLLAGSGPLAEVARNELAEKKAAQPAVKAETQAVDESGSYPAVEPARDPVAAAPQTGGTLAAAARQLLDDAGAEFWKDNPDAMLFQYIGPGAWLSDSEGRYLNMAKKMDEAGSDQDTIRLATGWFKGLKDGKWRYEIGDKNTYFHADRLTSEPASLDSVLDYPELFNKYPEAKDIVVTYLPESSVPAYVFAAFGQDDNGGKYILVRKETDNQWELRKSVLHELQHWIQEKEGFSTGANMGEIRAERDETKKEWDIVSTAYSIKRDVEKGTDINTVIGMYEELLGHPIDYQTAGLVEQNTVADLQFRAQELESRLTALGYFKHSALHVYRNTAGELEARDVESRMGLDEVQRRSIRPAFTSGAYSADMLFQTDEEAALQYRNMLDGAIRRDTTVIQSHEVIQVGNTPRVLEIAGADNLAVTISQSVVHHILKDHSEIDQSILAAIPEQLSDPLAVFSSKRPGGIVVVSDITTPSGPVVIAIELGREESTLVVNSIRSVYGKEANRGEINVFEEWIKEGRLRYLDNIKASSESRYTGVQFPVVLSFEERSTRNIVYKSDIVKSGEGFLFQTEAELVKDAASFDTWQEFMEFYEDSPFRPDDAAVPENADAQWYQTVWEKSRGLVTEESLNEEEAAEREALDDRTPGSPATMDALWLSEMQTQEGKLDAFLKQINWILTQKNDFAPADESELLGMQNVERLKRRITVELRHGSWISNATRLGAGRALTERTRRTLITLMRQASRDYRSLYADIMEDDYWAVALADTEAGNLAAISDPKLDYTEMTPEQRRKISDRIENQEIARKLKTGTLSLEEAERHIGWLKGALKESEERERSTQRALEEEKDETSADYRRISDSLVRSLLRQKEDLEMARARHESRSDQTSRLIERGQAITGKYEKETQQIKATYDSMFRKFSDLAKTMEISGAVKTALARRESLFEARAESARLREQISANREARKIRTTLVKQTMRRIPFNRVDFGHARKIIAIQRKFFPAMIKGLNKWIGTEGPYLREMYSRWKTDDEFKKELMFKLDKKKGGKKVLALFEKDFDTWTRSEREEAMKKLPKEDWIEELNLDALEKEREESLQMDESSDEFADILKEALPARIAARIENRPFAEWTIEEMEELAALVDTLYKQGKELFYSKKEARRAAAAETRDLIERTIKDAGIQEGDSDEEKKAKRAKYEKELLSGSHIKGTLAESNAKQSIAHRLLNKGFLDANVRRLARVLDGGKDGVNTDLLYHQEDECYNNEKRRIRERTARINAALDANGIELSELYKSVVLENFWAPGKSETITVDELLFVLKANEDEQSQRAVKFGNFIKDVEKDIYNCNEDILEALAGPRFNAARNAARALPEKFQRFADAISADYADQFERMNQASIEEFNQPVWRVQNYVPLLRLDSSGEQNENLVRDDLLNISGTRNQAGTEKGMTQKRIQIDVLHQNPVQMGLYSTWVDSVKRTEHFIAYAPYVRELNRVYKSRDASSLRGWLRLSHGEGVVKYIDQCINEVANPDAIGERSDIDRMIRGLRGKTVPAYLAWKISGVLKQFVTSPMPYLAHVNPVEYAAAAFDVSRNFQKMSEAIREKSVFMDSRVMDPVIDLIKEQQEKESNPAVAGWNQITSLGMQGLEFADWACVAPGWLAVYRKNLARLTNDNETAENMERTRLDELNNTGLAEEMKTAEEIKLMAEAKVLTPGEIERRAIKAADDATRLCQPSSRLIDLAPLFKERGKGTEALKIITQFQTSLNVIWQNIRYDLPAAVREKEYATAVGIVGGYVVAGIALNLMTQGAGDDDEDDMARSRRFVYYATTQFTDAVPLIGALVSTLSEKAITGKSRIMFGDDMFPVISKAVQAGVAVVDGDWEKSLLRTSEGLGFVFGAPVSGIKELYLAGNEISNGELPSAFIGRR